MTQENINDWTYCTLKVAPQDNESDALHELDLFESDVEDPDDGSPLSFYFHVQIPDILIDTIEDDSDDARAKRIAKTGYSSSFEFCKNRWGTLYDAVDVTLDYVDRGTPNEVLRYEFRTLEGHPLPWLKEVSSQFPLLVFEITCQNELDLFDSFDAVYLNGQQVTYQTHKK
jgi:hypothetical protein